MRKNEPSCVLVMHLLLMVFVLMGWLVLMLLRACSPNEEEQASGERDHPLAQAIPLPRESGAEWGGTRTSRRPARLLFRAAPGAADLDPQSQRRPQGAGRGRCAGVHRYSRRGRRRAASQTARHRCRDEPRFRQPGVVVLARRPWTRRRFATTPFSGPERGYRFVLLASAARVSRSESAASESNGNPQLNAESERRQGRDEAHHALHCAAPELRRQPDRVTRTLSLARSCRPSAQPNRPAVKPPSIEIVWPVT